MMSKLSFKLILGLVIFVLSAAAQTNSYRYKAELKGIQKNWHRIAIPNSTYHKLQPELADLRIFGISGRDTITVPYLLEKSANQVVEKEIAFKLINQSNTTAGYYFTFQATNLAVINQLRLAFEQANFDWRATLEGSNNNSQWFNIISDYRILAIKNAQTTYQYTQLNFPDSKYTYYRLFVKAGEQPKIQSAKILKSDTLKGIVQNVPVKTYQLVNHRDTKETVIEVGINELLPLSSLILDVKSKFDYYRSIKIEYATDTINTEKGTQYNYNSLYEGTLSVLEKPEFTFNGTLAIRLKVTIQNDDNPPLQFNGIQLKSAVYELIGRFDHLDYDYALYFGNEKVSAPIYELKNFENKIPLAITPLTVGSTQLNPAFKVKVDQPLFENKTWLWALMGLIISILGFFTYKMVKEK
jgi:hypothetical protein